MAKQRGKDHSRGGPGSSHKDATKPEGRPAAWPGTPAAPDAGSEPDLRRGRGTGKHHTHKRGRSPVRGALRLDLLVPKDEAARGPQTELL
jgi:hypothetical protein